MFVSYRAATAEGDGGNHRTYQILSDLQEELGHDRVGHLALDDWATRPESWRPVRRGALGGVRALPARLRQRLLRMTENPYRLLTRKGWSQRADFGTRGVLAGEFTAEYVNRVGQRGGADIGIVDHPLLDHIRSVNAGFGAPTIIASHNLESLDVGKVQLTSRVATQRDGVDFGNELWALSRFEARLAISRIEAAVLNGVGLTCQFYPYVPRGQVRARLFETARARAVKQPERQLFLVMGTAFHAPTRRSLQWFIARALRFGLPKRAQVVLVGSHVEDLVPPGCRIPGLDVRGRISEEELGDLLERVGTALVPQRMGFGALTRIPELSCAGVPSLVFPHASYAIDPSPGVRVLADDTWCTLIRGMCDAMEAPSPQIDPEEYCAWEARQSRPLGPALRRVLGD
jgi:hypothetical protein